MHDRQAWIRSAAGRNGTLGRSARVGVRAIESGDTEGFQHMLDWCFGRSRRTFMAYAGRLAVNGSYMGGRTVRAAMMAVQTYKG